MARIDSAFMKYVHRTLPSQMKDTNQILVGHAKSSNTSSSGLFHCLSFSYLTKQYNIGLSLCEFGSMHLITFRELFPSQ